MPGICPKVEVALAVCCNQPDAPLDKDTTFDFSSTPLERPPGWDSDSKSVRIEIGKEETEGMGNPNTVDSLVTLLASRLNERLRGTGVSVKAAEGSTVPEGEDRGGNPVAKLVFECVKAVDVAWDYSKIFGWSWGTPGFMWGESGPLFGEPVPSGQPTNTEPAKTEDHVKQPPRDPSAPWPGWAPGPPGTEPPPRVPPPSRPSQPPGPQVQPPPPPPPPEWPEPPESGQTKPGGLKPFRPAQPNPSQEDAWEDRDWKRLTLGICIGPALWESHPGTPPRWLMQSFTVPASWTQDRLMTLVANEWRLDALRPLFFESAPLLSVMWGVDAAPGVASGVIHMNLDLEGLNVQPVWVQAPALAEPLLDTSQAEPADRRSRAVREWAAEAAGSPARAQCEDPVQRPHASMEPPDGSSKLSESVRDDSGWMNRSH